MKRMKSPAVGGGVTDWDFDEGSWWRYLFSWRWPEELFTQWPTERLDRRPVLTPTRPGRVRTSHGLFSSSSRGRHWRWAFFPTKHHHLPTAPIYLSMPMPIPLIRIWIRILHGWRRRRPPTGVKVWKDDGGEVYRDILRWGPWLFLCLCLGFCFCSGQFAS